MRKRNLRTILYSVLLLIVVVSCKKKSGDSIAFPPLPTDVPGPVIQIDSFPLKVGNQWIYKIVEIYTGNPQTIDSSVYAITVVSDTVIDNIRAAKIVGNTVDTVSFLSANAQKPTGTFYYANLHDGLHQFSSPEAVREQGSTHSEFILKLPINSDTIAWYSNEPNGYDANGPAIYRYFSSFVAVTVPAGTFNTAKFHLFSPVASMDQYYCEKGLVQETQFIQVSGGRPPAGYTRIITLVSVNF
jgi:hypothetical protein